MFIYTIVAYRLKVRSCADQIPRSMLPEDRLTVIRKLAKEYGQMTVVGNGMNDASVRAALSFLPPILAAVANPRPISAIWTIRQDRLSRNKKNSSYGKFIQLIG